MGNDFFFLVEQMGTPKKHWFVHFNRTNGQWYFLFSRTHGQIHPWAIPLGTISKPKFFGLLAGLFNALSSSSPHFLSFTQSSLHRWPIERAKHFLHLSANGICTLIYMVISNPTQGDWVSHITYLVRWPQKWWLKQRKDFTTIWTWQMNFSPLPQRFLVAYTTNK